MDTVFDIGMYDGADSEYYLELGMRVVAVEANPQLVNSALARFSKEANEGRFICINAAMTLDGSPVSLLLNGADIGSSSLFSDRIQSTASVEVEGVTYAQLAARYGTPKFLKVDIEGADRYCILSVTQETRPHFASFEIGSDAEELLEHLLSVGFGRFKVINQIGFREIANVGSIRDRAARKMMHLMGYADPMRVRRASRFFNSGCSSGPVPWLSDGAWRSADSVRRIIRSGELSNWNDLHATV